MALGIAAAVYALKSEKNVGIGKSAGIAFAGLLVGTLIGSGVESWLESRHYAFGRLCIPRNTGGRIFFDWSLGSLFLPCLEIMYITERAAF